ncbi:MAG: radical SAM protein [Candidatus Methanosuratincola petrocarbonis]
MKIYLINPPFLKNFVRCGRWQGVRARGKTLYYPIWLSYATGILEQHSYETRLVDAIARKLTHVEALNDIVAYSPDVVVVDTNFSSLNNDINFAIAISKQLKDITIVITGPPTSVYATEILRMCKRFVVARKEFDYTILDIVKTIENQGSKNSILGISYIDNGKIFHNPDRPYLSSADLDCLPFVSKVYKKHLNINDYWLDHTLNPMVQIITSRGCPNSCTFCSWPENLTGRKFRARNPKNIVDEMEWVQKNLPKVKEIFFEDDNFTTNKNRVLKFCDEILNRKLDVIWSCQTRPTLDYETMKKMKDAGCRLLDVGYESGNDNILYNVKKGFLTKTSLNFAKNAKKIGLMVLGDFVFGLPGETENTIQQTIDFINTLQPDILQISIATPIPGTKFYEWCKANGYLLFPDPKQSIDDFGYQKCVISYPKLDNHVLQQYVNQALRKYYINPSYVKIVFKNISKRNGFLELKRILTSAKYFLIK